MKARVNEDAYAYLNSTPLKVKKNNVLEVVNYEEDSQYCVVKLWGFGCCNIDKKLLTIM